MFVNDFLSFYINLIISNIKTRATVSNIRNPAIISWFKPAIAGKLGDQDNAMNALTIILLALLVGLGPVLPPGDLPDAEVLHLAMSGFQKVVDCGEVAQPSLITIIDYSKPSTEPRLFVIDPAQGQVLHASLVAHGKNSGENEAVSFGNEVDSLRSSLGYFVTGEPYIGRHGYSLRLHGLEPGINDQALERNIVIHGASYVSQNYIAKYGRLGRSWGCPALPQDTNQEVIDLIKGGTCVFIYGNDSTYLTASVYTSAR